MWQVDCSIRGDRLLQDMTQTASSKMTRDRDSKSARGFSMLDTLLTVSLVAIVAAIAVPSALSGMGVMNVQSDARLIEQTLQNARLKAIQSNITVRVMFDCPVAGQYRIVELLGTQAVPVAPDGTVARCVESSYPYPPSSMTFYAPTAADGPLQKLGQRDSFVNDGSTATTKFFEFWQDGTVHRDNGSYPLAQIAIGAGAAVTNVAVTNGTKTISITVNGNGKIVDNR
jgi:Tfp pilus assembly protein FimT